MTRARMFGSIIGAQVVMVTAALGLLRTDLAITTGMVERLAVPRQAEIPPEAEYGHWSDDLEIPAWIRPTAFWKAVDATDSGNLSLAVKTLVDGYLEDDPLKDPCLCGGRGASYLEALACALTHCHGQHREGWNPYQCAPHDGVGGCSVPGAPLYDGPATSPIQRLCWDREWDAWRRDLDEQFGPGGPVMDKLVAAWDPERRCFTRGGLRSTCLAVMMRSTKARRDYERGVRSCFR